MPASAQYEQYKAVEQSEDFAQLRKRFRNFAFPMTAAFLIWYFTYVILSVYAVDFMSMKAIGNITIGLLISFGQFLTTFLITAVYIRHANKNLDPLASKLKDQLEGGEQA